MKIIISPAKKMIINSDDFETISTPQYLMEAQQLLIQLRTYSYSELKALWNTNDKLTQTNYHWLQTMDLKKQLTPAIIAYSGIQYQYMAPDLFTLPALNYIQNNLRILSAFYGILRPFDGIVPYRLEMQAKLSTDTYNNLYEFWNNKPYVALSSEPIINLASQEYSKVIRKYLQPDDQLIDIVFGHWVDGKIKTRATLAKMARGEMVRFMAENNLQNVNELSQFHQLGYQYKAELSTENRFVFLKD